jgi:hypothetical protein
MQWKPSNGAVVVVLYDDDCVQFAEQYTPDQADQLAEQIKQVAERARRGESVALHFEERDRLWEEGFGSPLGDLFSSADALDMTAAGDGDIPDPFRDC